MEVRVKWEERDLCDQAVEFFLMKKGAEDREWVIREPVLPLSHYSSNNTESALSDLLQRRHQSLAIIQVFRECPCSHASADPIGH